MHRPAALPSAALPPQTFAKCVAAIRGGGRPDEHWPRIAGLTQKVVCAVLESAKQGGKEVAFSGS